MRKACSIIVRGRVQGVGFRPFIFGLASKHSIRGTVQNNMDGVFINAEAEPEKLENFIRDIKSKLPRLAKIYELIVNETNLVNYDSFNIIESSKNGTSSLVIPIDASICQECSKELLDPNNRRFKYPFINCTECGPRYTIISELPYDRPFTSMHNFIMCDECNTEYENINDRRHHAQPNACEQCGPKYNIYDISGNTVNGEVLSVVCKLIKEGKILAIKGLGGYHLVCDATNNDSVELLRKRKKRPAKPLAIMTRDINKVKKICKVNEKSEELLSSIEAPIVLLEKLKGINIIPNSIAPQLNTIGVMLPYTPFHLLLFSEEDIDFLIMTSANPSGLPMLAKDSEAFNYLKDIADYVVTNDREILHSIDDSVVQIVGDSEYMVRRARGYVPEPISTEYEVNSIIALGSQQKNTFAIGRNEQIFIGPHIGDLNSLEVSNHFLEEFNHLNKWMGVTPNKVALDYHPSYKTNDLASEFQGDLVRVQHHHAHLVSCMVDNNIVDETVLGIILDGTGYGLDGNIWGFEILEGNESYFNRLAHLRYSRLPGGDRSILEPWKNAVGMLYSLLDEKGKDYAKRLFSDKENEIEIICNMINKGINSPFVGSCGRLFDAVSSILGISNKITYDGEAAIRLCEFADNNLINQIESYDFCINPQEELLDIDFSLTLENIVKDKISGKSTKEISTKFHQTVITSITECLKVIKMNRDLPIKVVLSGGSFHNQFLLIGLTESLTKEGFIVHQHQRFPTNDGGISLGQIVIASKI